MVLTFFSAVAQLIALVWYLVSYFPMGSSGIAPTVSPIKKMPGTHPNASPHYNTGLRFASQLGVRRAASWMQG